MCEEKFCPRCKIKARMSNKEEEEEERDRDQKRRVKVVRISSRNVENTCCKNIVSE